MFTGGPELCLQVEAEHIAQIFDFIVSTENPAMQSKFMKVLQAMAKVEINSCIFTLCTLSLQHFSCLLQIEKLDLPVLQNQLVIVQQFCKQREDSYSDLNDLLGEEKEKRAKRWKTLTVSSDPYNPDCSCHCACYCPYKCNGMFCL